mgnify:CR=1 FL=1
MAHAAIAFCQGSSSPTLHGLHDLDRAGATNMVTAAAVAHVNRASRPAPPRRRLSRSRQPDPVLQQVEDFRGSPPSAPTTASGRSRADWDRIVRPEQLMASLPAAFEVLTDPGELRPGHARAAPGCSGRGLRSFRALLRARTSTRPRRPGLRCRRACGGGRAAPPGPAAARSSPAGGVHYSCRDREPCRPARRAPRCPGRRDPGRARGARLEPCLAVGSLGVTGIERRRTRCRRGRM